MRIIQNFRGKKKKKNIWESVSASFGVKKNIYFVFFWVHIVSKDGISVDSKKRSRRLSISRFPGI